MLTTLNTRPPAETVGEDTQAALKCMTRRLACNYRKNLRRLCMAGRHDVVVALERLAHKMAYHKLEEEADA